MNFYDEMQTGEAGASSAIAKLEKAIVEMRMVLVGVKPERNFKTGEVKRYFNIDGSPTVLYDKLTWIKRTFQN